MSISRLMQMGAAGVSTESSLIVDQTSTFTTPLQNATISQNRVGSTTWPALASRTYDTSDYSWTLTSNPTSFSGYTAFIDWNIDEQSNDIVVVVGYSNIGTVFNNRGAHGIGLCNADASKYFLFNSEGYRSDGASGYYTSSKTETSGELTVTGTDVARSNWYVGFRYSMSTGAFKGYGSNDNGSNWTLRVSGTHAAYADMTQAFSMMNRRTGTGSKVALLDASLYKDDIVL